MNDLRSVLDVTLDHAVNQAAPLDHVVLQRRGLRLHRLRIVSAVAGVVILVAVATSAGLMFDREHPTFDVADQPDSAVVTEPATGADEPSAPTENFQDWYERKRENVDRAIALAPAEQKHALADGVVTESELEDARVSFADCMRAEGHKITLHPEGGYDIVLGGKKPTDDEHAQQERDESRCAETHLNAISAAWEWQQMDHQGEWSRWQREHAETQPPGSRPEPMTEGP